MKFYINEQQKSPCVNCNERSVTCHSTCEKYLKYREHIDTTNKNMRRERILYEYKYESAVRKGIERKKRQK